MKYISYVSKLFNKITITTCVAFLIFFYHCDTNTKNIYHFVSIVPNNRVVVDIPAIHLGSWVRIGETTKSGFGTFWKPAIYSTRLYAYVYFWCVFHLEIMRKLIPNEYTQCSIIKIYNNISYNVPNTRLLYFFQYTIKC